ncbi:MerR family transcriptional regulator [Amedibacillus sp. YH-ame6]
MKTYSLKEVSKMLDIPKSTLRYWEKEGLIRSKRNEQNEYREYTTEELVVIGDIAFYRSLQLPIKALKNLYLQSVPEKHQLLTQSYDAIEAQIQALYSIQEKISRRIESIKLYDSLTTESMIDAPIPFSQIQHLHMEKHDTVQAYLNDQNLLAIVFDEQHLHLNHYGLTQQQVCEDSNILWTKNKNATYIPCLIRVKDRMVMKEDIQPILDDLHTQQKCIGSIIGRYLITDTEIDFFQSWIEVLPSTK